jgi:5-(carboxyamino)imidazole ribonucleotide synthase
VSAPILPGARLGMLGGGQLGRMFGLSARAMGYRFEVFAPEANPCAAAIADRHHRASFDDRDALAAFADSVDVITFEFENVPASSVEWLAEHKPVRPGARLLHATQHRVREKTSVRETGALTADFLAIREASDLARALEEVGTPAILKTATFGYDGKGQTRVRSADDAEAAWERIGRREAIWEALIPFEREISVVAARSATGEMAVYEPSDNHHVDHILDVSVAPSSLPDALRRRAQEVAKSLLEAWEVVGVLCVEFFVLEDGRLLVNEIAPRTHNSGHLTMDAAQCGQFEQQVRAICGLPLGSTALRGAGAMANLLGQEWETSSGAPNWSAALEHAVHLHLYDKGEARPGRKMGHLNASAPTPEAARECVLAARQALRS